MAIIDNTIAGQMPTFDPATPLMQAAKLQAADQESRQAQFKQAQIELGTEARGLAAVQNSPEFPKLWAEAADRMKAKGLLDDRAHAQWRNTPSPLLLKQMIAQTEDPTLQFNKSEAVRLQGNTDRSFGLQKTNADRNYSLAERTATRLEDRTPANYTPDPAKPGAVIPVAGGPADPTEQLRIAGLKREDERKQREQDAATAGLAPGTPEYQQFLATGSYTRPKPKDLPTSVVKDMGEKGGLLEDFTRLDNGFKDEYGGFKTAFAGDAVNTIARNTGIGNEERAQWWQDYQNQKNIVRNKLFGSALTATEKAEFDKANIHPGMTPGTIRANLALQRDASRRAAAKLVNTYSKMGYSQDQIEAATGFPLSEVQTPAAKPAASASAKGVVSYTDYFK